MNDSLFNEADDLDEQLNDFVGRRTLVSKMQEKSKDRPALDDMSLGSELQKNAWLYFFLLISSIFTATLGFMMGIAPERRATGMYYNTDAGHLLLALIYAVAFVTVTEFAFGLAKWLYFKREENNMRQRTSMLTMMVVSGISIIATGIAGGMVIASTIAFLSDFQAIPHQAQVWVIVAIPTLMFVYAICGTVYILSSDEASAKRLVREKQRENDLDHETRHQLIRQWGREQVQREHIKVYIRLVKEGKMTAGEAQAAMDAGLTLGQAEVNLKRDLDGDGAVGSPSRNNHHEPTQQYASETPDFTKPRKN